MWGGEEMRKGGDREEGPGGKERRDLLPKAEHPELEERAPLFPHPVEEPGPRPTRDKASCPTAQLGHRVQRG